MLMHTEIKIQMYDYLKGELTGGEAAKVRRHVDSCRECASELSELENFIERSASFFMNPSEERPSAYWENFATEVERKIQPLDQTGKRYSRTLLEDILFFLIPKRISPYAFSAAMALLVAALTFWKLASPPLHKEVKQIPAVQVISPNPDERVGQYLRKSRALLVGISNFKAERGQPRDMSAERKISRQLVHEARYLKHQPMDLRSAELIGDMEKILIKLANLREKNDVPDVELIRSGIHQDNLLFKIRMAEARYDTGRYIALEQDILKGY